MFGGSHAFLGELQGCVRYVVATGKLKVDYLDRIPLLFARLREPGVRAQCLLQYGQPDAIHYDVSKEFLNPDLQLRQHVDNIRDDGTGVTSVAISLWGLFMRT